MRKERSEVDYTVYNDEYAAREHVGEYIHSLELLHDTSGLEYTAMEYDDMGDDSVWFYCDLDIMEFFKENGDGYFDADDDESEDGEDESREEVSLDEESDGDGLEKRIYSAIIADPDKVEACIKEELARIGSEYGITCSCDSVDIQFGAKAEVTLTFEVPAFYYLKYS